MLTPRRLFSVAMEECAGSAVFAFVRSGRLRGTSLRISKYYWAMVALVIVSCAGSRVTTKVSLPELLPEPPPVGEPIIPGGFRCLTTSGPVACGVFEYGYVAPERLDDGTLNDASVFMTGVHLSRADCATAEVALWERLGERSDVRVRTISSSNTIAITGRPPVLRWMRSVLREVDGSR